jgi:hypothetical protein
MDTSQTVKLKCADGKVVQPLPNVCMACGRPATQIHQWTATTQPLWAVALSGLGSSNSLGSKQVTIQMPLCEEHGRAKDRVKTVGILGLVFLGVVLALLFIVVLNESLLALLRDALGAAILLIVPLVVVISVLVVGVLVMMTANALPRVQRIDESSVTLKGVSDKFRRAMMQAEGQQAA